MNDVRRGFTLVELIIVIVVIAILAAISVVTYRGIQQRAETQKIESTIVSYIKALEMYRAVHGVWPTPDDEYYSYGAICLGPTSDYPAADGFEEGQCFQNLNAPAVRGHALDEIAVKLADFTQGLHDNIDKKPWYMHNGYQRVRGAHFQYLDPNFVEIIYAVPGERDCVSQGSNAGMSYQSRYMENQNLTQCIIDMWFS